MVIIPIYFNCFCLWENGFTFSTLISSKFKFRFAHSVSIFPVKSHLNKRTDYIYIDYIYGCVFLYSGPNIHARVTFARNDKRVDRRNAAMAEGWNDGCCTMLLF